MTGPTRKTDADAAEPLSAGQNAPAMATPLLLRISLLVGGLVVALLIAEGLLRWVFPYQFIYKHPRFVVHHELESQPSQIANRLLAPGLALNDQPWRYALRKDLRAQLVSSEFDVSFETNDQGLRGPPLRPQPDLRILGLGDSFAMGFGVENEETYLSVLSRQWAATTTQDVEPVQGGVIGYNPHNSAAYLFGNAATLQPDIVIVQLWVGDDLCGARTPARPVEQGAESLANTIKAMLSHWHLGMLVRDRLRALAPIRRWLMQRGLINRYAIDALLSQDFLARCATSLEALSTRLAELQAFCHEHDIRLLALLIPVREQVYTSDWERTLAYDGVAIDTSTVDTNAPNRIIQQMAHDRGVPLFDATPVLRTHRDDERLYFEGLDPHLTARGHAVIGTALFPVLHPIAGNEP